jgi:hypothetical protein
MYAIVALALFQSAPVNSLFSLDADLMRRSYEAGRKACKDKEKADALMRPYYREIGKVRTPIFQHWHAPYAVFQPPYLRAQLLGFEDERLYNDDKGLKDMLADDEQNPDCDQKHVWFFVNLFAWPGVNHMTGGVNRAANPDDVKDLHFVMIIDGDKEHAVHPIAAPIPGKSEAGEGSYSIPEFDTVYSKSVTRTPFGTVRSTSSYTFYTERQNSFNYYRAEYHLMFPLYDASGSPYLTDKTKTVELKVIYPSGEHSALYKLADYKLP